MAILPFTDPQWKGVQLPSKEDAKVAQTALELRAGAKTDWWRSAKGSIPESDVDRHDGPLYVFDVNDDEKSWTASVWLAVDHNERFQQATLFVGQGDYQTGKEPWLKAGIEIEDGKQNIG
ncbi:hypothetical protein L7F22_039104 [Adiantum nelumboides]|nr:hypothetical protein [Adiantum nelumboides]